MPAASVAFSNRPGDEVELDREPRAAVHHEARQEAGAREEVVGLLDVAVDEHVLPGHQHLVENEHRVVLVEARRQRIVERRAHDRRRHLVRRAADELHARRVGRHHEHHGEFLVLHRDQPVVGDEGVVGQHRAGGDHLGAGDDDAGVGLLLHVAADVAHLVRRPVAVDGRMDDGVVDERHALLAELVPALGVLLVRRVEVGVGAEGREERRLVIGRAAHPAIGELGPFGDGVPAGDELLHVLRRLEERVGVTLVAGVGRQQELVLALGVVQRVVEARDHPGGVAEGRVRGDVLDALAVDVDLAAVLQRFQVFLAGLRLGDGHLADGLGLGGEGRFLLLQRGSIHGISPCLRARQRQRAVSRPRYVARVWPRLSR